MESVRSNIKISVIVPVYNAAPFLRQCLDMVLAQAISDIEIICVNDGSTDNSLEILQEYSQADSRVICVSQENQGAGIARNTALRHAVGEYVVFLDPDDYYPDENVLAKLYEAVTQNGCLIAGGGLESIRPDGSTFRGAESAFQSSGIVEYRDYQFDFNISKIYI